MKSYEKSILKEREIHNFKMFNLQKKTIKKGIVQIPLDNQDKEILIKEAEKLKISLASYIRLLIFQNSKINLSIERNQEQ